MATDITELVHAAGGGDRAALQALFAAVYDEIKRLAHRQLARPAHPTPDTTGPAQDVTR